MAKRFSRRMTLCHCEVGRSPCDCAARKHTLRQLCSETSRFQRRRSVKTELYWRLVDHDRRKIPKKSARTDNRWSQRFSIPLSCAKQYLIIRRLAKWIGRVLRVPLESNRVGA